MKRIIKEIFATIMLILLAVISVIAIIMIVIIKWLPVISVLLLPATLLHIFFSLNVAEPLYVFIVFFIVMMTVVECQQKLL